MRVIVCGGRDYNDVPLVERILRTWPVYPSSKFGDLRWRLRHQYAENPSRITIVHGAARGADTLAGRAAKRFGYLEEPHPAEWKTCRCVGVDHLIALRYCPRAGFVRNMRMARLGADLCVAFPGGTGTADMVARARTRDIPVLEIGRTLRFPPPKVQTNLLE